MYYLPFLLTAFGYLLMSQCAAKIPSDEQKTVSAQKIIGQINKGEHIYYENVSITGTLDFTEVTQQYFDSNKTVRHEVSSSITFVNCIFKNELIAYKKDDIKTHFVSFFRNVSFQNCRFEGEVNFKEVTVNELANFAKTTFDKKATFEGSDFRNKLIFTECTFYDTAKFQGILCRRDANFMKSNFEGQLSFQNATFENNAQFSATNYLKYADFTNVTAKNTFLHNYANFNERLVFNNATFYNRTEFINCDFKQLIDFEQAAFYSDIIFAKSNFEEVNMNKVLFAKGKPIITQCNFKTTTPNLKGASVIQPTEIKLLEVK